MNGVRLKQLLPAIAIAATLMFATTGKYAFADNLNSNDVDTTTNSATIIVSGTTDVRYWIVSNNGDGQTGCNAADGSPAHVTLSLPAGLTANTTSLSLNQCKSGSVDNGQGVRFTGVYAGTFIVNASVSDSGVGTYNTNPSTMTITVKKAGPSISTTLSSTSVNLGDSFSDTAIISGLANPTGLGTITFNVYSPSDTTCTSTAFDTKTVSNINANGNYGSGTFAATTETGTYHVIATFSGDANNNSTKTSCADESVIVSNPSPPSDITAPTIDYKVNGDLNTQNPNGNNGWWKSGTVKLQWIVTENESPGSLVKTGCVDQTITTDTAPAGNTFSCSASSDGGTAGPVTVTIKRDSTAPTITSSATPSPNPDGWNNATVTVSFTCGDATSGIASCTTSSNLDEGAGQSVTGTATDNAGNTNSTTVSNINVDETAPTIQGAASPLANANGWNNGPVTVTFTCNDSLSGIKSCTSPVTLSSEGAGQSVTGTAIDNADNSASTTVSPINIDLTAPNIVGSRTPGPNANGWNNQNVTVSFVCADALSGIATCPSPTTLYAEGAAQSVTGTAVDKAGNTNSTTVSNVNIDKTKPTVSLVGGPVNGTSYYFGFVPSAPTCSASDALSGLDGSCTGPSGYSTSIGTHTITTSATDKAGNTATTSVTYTVMAWTLKGFYQPVSMSPNAPSDIVWNTLKGGQTVPLKFEIFAGNMEFTTTTFNNTPIGTFTTQKVSCGLDATPLDDPVDQTTTGGTTFRYDTTSGQYIQNWQTPKQTGICYTATFTAQDGSSLTAYFKLK